VAKLQDSESIVLKCEGDPTEEATKVRSGLNGGRACRFFRRSAKLVDGKIVITREGFGLRSARFNSNPRA